jgi:hypothetical protein
MSGENVVVVVEAKRRFCGAHLVPNSLNVKERERRCGMKNKRSEIILYFVY